MLLAIGVLALAVRVVLSAVPGPETPVVVEAPADAAPLIQNDQPNAAVQTAELPQADESIIEVMPFSLNGSVPAPLIASILRQHRPELTDQHAGELMNTLPPGSTHRMIVILPESKAAGDETF